MKLFRSSTRGCRRYGRGCGGVCFITGNVKWFHHDFCRVHDGQGDGAWTLAETQCALAQEYGGACQKAPAAY